MPVKREAVNLFFGRLSSAAEIVERALVGIHYYRVAENHAGRAVYAVWCVAEFREHLGDVPECSCRGGKMPAGRKTADKDICRVDVVFICVFAYVFYGKRGFNQRGIICRAGADSVAEQEYVKSCGKKTLPPARPRGPRESGIRRPDRRPSRAGGGIFSSGGSSLTYMVSVAPGNFSDSSIVLCSITASGKSLATF